MLTKVKNSLKAAYLWLLAGVKNFQQRKARD
jgi:hypothetical protein